MTFRAVTHMGGNDLTTPLCGAENLLAGKDPYDCHWPYQGGNAAPYPMTTILAVMPFAPLAYPGMVLFWSLTVGLLVFAILFRGKVWQLLIFTSAPFWVNAYHLQIPVLLAALYLLPEALPLAMVKPQGALPLLLKITKKRFAGMVAFGLLTLAVYPLWPLRWLEKAQSYDGFIPALVFPACLIFLPLLLVWKDERARFLALTAVSPQRWLYDTLTVWLLVERPSHMLILSAGSWMAYAVTEKAFTQYAVSGEVYTLLLIYLPAVLAIVHGSVTRNNSAANLWLARITPVLRYIARPVRSGWVKLMRKSKETYHKPFGE